MYNDYDGILTFLNKIWPLKDLPSQDSRYKNAYEDARQHLVNNDDWTPEFTYTERFNLLSGDEIFFIKFLEAIVSPDVRKGLEDIKSYVRLINDRLKDNPEQLVLVDYFEELPVFKYSLKEHTDDLP